MTGKYRREVFATGALPAGFQALVPLFICGRVTAQINRRRRALKYIKLFRVFTHKRDTLNGGGAGANDGDALVGKLGEPAVVIAAGVVVIPAGSMEGMALERRDTRYAGQLRAVSGAGGLNDKLRANLVVAMSGHVPMAALFAPLNLCNAGLKDRVVVEPEVFANALGVFENFGRKGVFFLWHDAGFF